MSAATSSKRSAREGVLFYLNGKRVEIPAEDVDPSVLLFDYIHEQANLKGTKLGCGEGGCGACAVTVSEWDASKKKVVTRSANSCLKPLAACDGLSVTTVEGLCGKDGSNHPVADRIHKLHGSQCGYCTPGMVMAIFAGLQKNAKPTEKDMERCLDGNICRCTGYRPILDAAKSFASDSKVVDHIRNEIKSGPHDPSRDPAFPDALKVDASTLSPNAEFSGKIGGEFGIGGSGPAWIRASSLDRISDILAKRKDVPTRFVVGDTCLGVYKRPSPVAAKIDIRRVAELRCEPQIGSNDELVIGAARTLTDLLDAFEGHRGASITFGPLADHIRKIANTHVRNQASIAGNLVMARTMGFLSDLAPILQGAGASLDIYDASASRKIRTVTMDSFLAGGKTMPVGDVIVRLRVPVVRDARTVFRTYRSAVRPINCHAIANAALFAKLDASGAVEESRLVFNGIMAPDAQGSTPVRASRTESFLKGKLLCVAKTFDEAATVLAKELGDLIDAGVSKQAEYTDKDHGVVARKLLVRSFFTKFALTCASIMKSDAADPAFCAAERDLADRKVVESKQTYPNVASGSDLVGRPLPNQTAHLQVAGKATYVGDIVHRQGTGYACIVGATRASAKISKIDASAALASPGVFGWVGAEDVPGKNSSSPLGEPYPFPPEAFPQYTPTYLFVPVGGRVGHFGQAIGIVVARTRAEAFAAAKRVVVTYDEVREPVLSIEDGLKKSPGGPCPDLSGSGLPTQTNMKTGDVEEALKDASTKRVRGQHLCGSQKHFYIETQSAYAYWTEGGVVRVHSSNQWPQAVQDVCAASLGVPQHKVDITCRRIGGGYGGKLVCAAMAAAYVAIGSRKLGRPVALQFDRNRDMMMVGGREEMKLNYEVAYRPSDGLITALSIDNYVTGGHCVSLSWFANISVSQAISEAYGFKNFKSASKMVFTNKAPRSAVRGPGEIEASTAIETIIHHVAHASGISAHKVRERNILRHPGFEDAPIEKMASVEPPSDPEKCGKIPGSGAPAMNFTIPKMWVEMKRSVKYDARADDIRKFNADNVAKKRGIALVPIRYGVNVWKKSALVCIYKDGTVLIRHGAMQMGQGCNVKIAQAASLVLGQLLGETFPLDRIEFAPFSSSVLSSQTFTGGSTGTEGAAAATMKACKKLVESFEPIRDALKKKAAEAAEKNSSGDGGANSDVTWASVCAAAEQANLPMQALGQHGGEKSKDKLAYNCYGVGCSEVELDTMTGEIVVLRTDILYDAAKSMNPMVDIGQAEGAFMMGLGFVTQEEVCFDKKTGHLLGHGTWEYKPPQSFNVPRVFNVTLAKNDALKDNILSSKASGEPPLVLASSVLMAIREAIASFRRDAGLTDFFELNPPCTTEAVLGLLAPAHAALKRPVFKK